MPIFVGPFWPSLFLSNGKVNYSRSHVQGAFPVNTTAYSMCDTGYTLFGSTSRICQTSGNWDQQPPNCSNEFYKKIFYVIFYLFHHPLCYKNEIYLNYNSRFLLQRWNLKESKFLLREGENM